MGARPSWTVSGYGQAADKSDGNTLPAGRRRIGLLMVGLADLGGGGGTERFFADVFAAYDCAAPARFDVRLIADTQSLNRLAAIKRQTRNDHILTFDENIVSLSGIRDLYRLCRDAQIDLLHIPLASRRYLPFLWYLQRRGADWCPALAMTMPDVTLSYTWHDPSRCRSLHDLKAWVLYRAFFHTVRLDGVLAWFERFVDKVGSEAIRGRPLTVPAAHCFVDTERFQPAQAKRRLIVFAGRLIRVKRPILFLDGIELALAQAPTLLEGWEVAVYGRGPLEEEVRRRIDTGLLKGRVILDASPNMAPVFAESRLFVSTHDYDNFTSLSLLEAMACGNAVIARDHGQTSTFVRHGRNGLVFSKHTAEGLADALINYLSQPECHAAMEAESRRIAVEEQNVANFLQELDHFWLDVLSRYPSKN